MKTLTKPMVGQRVRLGKKRRTGLNRIRRAVRSTALSMIPVDEDGAEAQDADAAVGNERGRGGRMGRLYKLNEKPVWDDRVQPHRFDRLAPQTQSGGSTGGMSNELRQTLMLLSSDLASIHQHSPRMSGKELAKNELRNFVEQSIALYSSEAALSESAAYHKEALTAIIEEKNYKKMTALCEMRKETINNYVRAKSHFLEMFFEEVVLGQNDSAYITNETMYAQAVYYMAQDGKLRVQRAINALSNFLVPLYFVASQKYGYQIEDIQRGNITQPALKSVDIGFDIAAQKDYNAFLALTGGLARASTNGGVNGIFGAFTTTLTSSSTAQQLLTFFPSPRIIAANLPTTNVLAPWPDPMPAGIVQAAKGVGYWQDLGGNPVIGFNCAHAILRYCDQFANVFMDGPLRPTGLLVVPALDATSVLSTVNPTAAKPSMIAEGLLSNYTRFEYGGVVWTMMPDATIPRGTLYAVLNKPVGKNFTKPSFDREFVNTDYEANWEDRWFRSTQGLYIPVQNTPKAVAVTYM